MDSKTAVLPPKKENIYRNESDIQHYHHVGRSDTRAVESTPRPKRRECDPSDEQTSKSLTKGTNAERMRKLTFIFMMMLTVGVMSCGNGSNAVVGDADSLTNDTVLTDTVDTLDVVDSIVTE